MNYESYITTYDTNSFDKLVIDIVRKKHTKVSAPLKIVKARRDVDVSRNIHFKKGHKFIFSDTENSTNDLISMFGFNYPIKTVIVEGANLSKENIFSTLTSF